MKRSFCNYGKCPYANADCYCEQCHHGTSRPEGCEEVVNDKEKVEFT